MAENTKKSPEPHTDAAGTDPGVLQVSLDLLDTLMNLAGELVLSRNQLLQGINAEDMKVISQSGQRIDLITSELQNTIMRTRMQTIDGLFQRFKQQIIDMGQNRGMELLVPIEGSEVELDKTVLEAVAAPLERLVEYCLVHGMETGAEREATGKPQNGVISLKAFHDAGQVNIRITDDGTGRFDDTLGQALAAEIEALGGVMDIHAVPGKGTDTQVKLPLTLAIIPSQIASVGGERYALPQSNLGELLRIPAAEVRERIETVGNAEVVRLRGELLPVLNLSHLLDIPAFYTDDKTGERKTERRKQLADRRSGKYGPAGEKLEPGAAPPAGDWRQRQTRDRRQKAVNIAVVFAGNYKYGLMIDQLHDSEEIVVKPVGRHIRGSKWFSGATIMGDGRVALILDILNLAQMAGLSTLSESADLMERVEQTAQAREDLEAMVIFKNQDTEFFSAPLEAVVRIERIESDQIEHIGTRKVAQYRGGALPLLELSDGADLSPLPKRPLHEVIVFNIAGREFGIMVTPPVDTVRAAIRECDTTLKQKGIKGSLIINGNTTLLVDLNDFRKLVE